jgi:DNA polymerase III delta subunit
MSSKSATGSGGIKPAYLIAGTDAGKIDAALSRLRARAEREGGPGALESFTPAAGPQAPDADALIAAIPSMSLMASRR